MNNQGQYDRAKHSWALSGVDLCFRYLLWPDTAALSSKDLRFPFHVLWQHHAGNLMKCWCENTAPRLLLAIQYGRLGRTSVFLAGERVIQPSTLFTQPQVSSLAPRNVLVYLGPNQNARHQDTLSDHTGSDSHKHCYRKVAIWRCICRVLLIRHPPRGSWGLLPQKQALLSGPASMRELDQDQLTARKPKGTSD